jgi:hypothetical protein
LCAHVGGLFMRVMFAAAVFGCLAPLYAFAADPAGRIKTLEGRAYVLRDGAQAPLTAGSDIFTADQIVTGAGSKLGLILIDDTVMSMGPSSVLSIDRMLFEPEQDKLDMGVMMKAGTFSVQSGQIAKLAPVRADIRTPQMSIGIRGTAFLVEVDGE